MRRASSIKMLAIKGSLCSALCLSPFFLTMSASAASGLMPHRAVYDMELSDASEASGISALTGLMVYDFVGNACDGYSITFRFVTEFFGADGGSQVTDLRTSSFEDGAGENFQFLSKTFVDQKLVETTRGTAKDLGKTKSLELKEPEERAVTLDDRALFPTVHLRKIIEAAKSGKSFVAADIFDGSETGDKIFSTTTVIGKLRSSTQGEEPVHSDDPDIAKLSNSAHWPVTIAYFDPSKSDGGEEFPIYQLSFLLYENGISRQMTLDYGDFAIKGSLRDLELFDVGACGQTD